MHLNIAVHRIYPDEPRLHQHGRIRRKQFSDQPRDQNIIGQAEVDRQAPDQDAAGKEAENVKTRSHDRKIHADVDQRVILRFDTAPKRDAQDRRNRVEQDSEKICPVVALEVSDVAFIDCILHGACYKARYFFQKE